MKKTILALIISAIAVFPSISGAQGFSTVVSCERKVTKDCPPTSGGGAVLGGGGGAWLGRALVGGPIGLIGGAIAGGMAGNAIEKRSNCAEVTYFLVTLKNGQTFESNRAYRKGQRVEID